MAKATDAFRTIGEVSDELDVPKHVLRFWEGKFPQLKPMKRGGGRRFYRPEDVTLLRGIHRLLHAAGYTIKGVQRILREDGVDAVKSAVQGSVEASARSADGQAQAQPSSKRRGRSAASASPPLSSALRKDLGELLDELQSCLALAHGGAQAAPEVRVTGGKAKRG